MTSNIWKYFKIVLLFLIYLLYDYIITLLFHKIGFNITNLPNSTKMLVIILRDLSLMFILYLIYRKDINNNFKNYFKNFKSQFRFGLKYWIIGLIIMVLANAIIAYYYPGNSTNENLVYSYTMKYPLYMLFSSVIYAPFVEEILFRKSLKEVFTNDFVYIIVGGLLFGLAHTLSGNSLKEFLYLIPYGALGCAFCYIYAKTNNIFVSMTFHMIHNAIIMGYYLIFLLGA